MYVLTLILDGKVSAVYGPYTEEQAAQKADALRNDLAIEPEDTDAEVKVRKLATY